MVTRNEIRTSYGSQLHRQISADLEATHEKHAESADYHTQLTVVATGLEEALARNDLAGFYRVFRSTDLPFIGTAYESDTYGLFRLCFEILHRLGSISPAAALAIENHFYVSSTIATFPTSEDQVLDKRRRSLLASIADGRFLVANTNSRVHGNKLGEIGTCARREGSGFRIAGTAAYTSLATEADMLIFITQIADEGPAVFAIAPMQGNPAIEIGPYLFPAAMLDSDTRRITFHDLFVPMENLVVSAEDAGAGLLFDFEMAWHQLLIPALYLGAAAGAIEEVRKFLRVTRGKDERPLAELDGMVIDMGRLSLDYRSACCVVLQAAESLARVRRLPQDAELLNTALNDASAAKYVGTRCSEGVVTAARRIVGARAFVGGHPLERLSQEVMFASLGPEVSAVIERRHGHQALGEHSFLDRRW